GPRIHIKISLYPARMEPEPFAPGSPLAYPTRPQAMSSAPAPHPAAPAPANGDEVRAALSRAAAERILILDGAMGTMIQALKLDEAGYRGERFADWHKDVRGNNDLLNLTQPAAV